MAKRVITGRRMFGRVEPAIDTFLLERERERTGKVSSVYVERERKEG